MKIYSITSTLNPHINRLNQQNSNNNSYSVTSPLKREEQIHELPSFHSVGKSIAFKSSEEDSNVKRTMQKIEETKKQIEVLKNSNGPEPPKEVKEAREKLKDYNWWQSVKDSEYKRVSALAEEARVKNKRWYGSYGVRARDKVMEDMYYSKSRLYDLSYNDHTRYKQVLKVYDDNVAKSAEQRAEQIKLLEKMLEEYEKHMDYASLYDEINSASNTRGGINDRIAGYRGVKDEIVRKFLNPLIASQNDPNVKIPSAIMLYGALGCGKTAFLDAIGEESKKYAEVVDLSKELTPDTKSFKAMINHYLDQAKKRYQETGKRTIILLNEAEQFFCMTPEAIEDSGMFLNASDIQMVETYNENTNPTANVNYFKSLFDVISKTPTEEDPRGCATTMLITTNYPHLIHRDLLSRDGKYGKLMKIAVKPAEKEDLREVLEFYFKKFSNLIETVKMCAKRENRRDLIMNFPNITEQGKKVLLEKANDGTIVNMHIDPTGGGFKDYEQFLKGNSPSPTRGAYSNVRIQNIAEEAFVKYMENPAVPYEKHFCDIKNAMGCDITSQTYNYFNNICEMVENPEKYKNIKADISENLWQMRQEFLDGQLSKEDIVVFKQMIKDFKARYKELKKKPDLTELEQKVLEQQRTFLDAVEDLDFD